MQPGRGVLSVSELTSAVKEFLEVGFPSVIVEGEITGLRSTTGKHLYFSLKDETSLIKVVWFSWATRSAQPPADGQQVRITGRLAVYEAQGVYQLVVSSLEAVGLGDLLARLEKLKKALEAEGLFLPERKRPIPVLPETIGLVTSPTGAAVQDMLRILLQAQVPARIRIFPVAVQGVEAAQQITNMIRYVSDQTLADVLVVGRGGGSVEDLLAFSDERVVRAIAQSTIPVISAVGHEIDSPLSDFAADLRVPTPTAAAETLARYWTDVIDALDVAKQTLSDGVQNRLERARTALSDYRPERLHESFERILQPYYQRFDDAQTDLNQAWTERLEGLRRRVELAKTALEALSPYAVLERGYALISRNDGRPVVKASELKGNDEIHLRFSDGEVSAIVKEKSHEEL